MVKSKRALVLGVGALLMGLGFTPLESEVYAEGEVTDSGNMQVNLEIPTYIAITQGNNVSLDAIPTPSGTFVSGQSTVTTETNNGEGYTLMMGMKKDVFSTNTNALVAVSPLSADSQRLETLGSAVTIPSLTDGANFTVNKWGYAFGENAGGGYTFNPLPGFTNGKPDHVTYSGTLTAPGRESKSVFFGAKVDSTTYANSYHNTVVFTAIANPVPDDIFDDEEPETKGGDEPTPKSDPTEESKAPVYASVNPNSPSGTGSAGGGGLRSSGTSGTAGGATGSSESNDGLGSDETSGNLEESSPKGERSTREGDGSGANNLLPAVLIGTGAVAGATGLILLAAKRKKDDDEEEEA